MTDLINPVAQAYQIFFTALRQNSNEALIEAASNLFGCPVLLTDENYKLLYQYPAEKIGQSIWDTLYETGTLPIETIWDYQSTFLQSKDLVYEPFYADYGLAKEYPRIFAEIYTDKKQILGHVAIFLSSRKLQPHDLEITKIFTDALCIRMASKNASTRSDASYLQDLLNPKVSSQRKLLAKRILTERLQGNFSVMVIPAGQTAAQKAFITRAVSFLNQSFRNTVSAFYENCIVTIFGEIHGDTYTEKEKEFLRKVANSLPQAFPNAGISNPFHAIEDVCIYYQQAHLVASLEKNEVSFFSQYASETFFVPALQVATKEAYIHPVLHTIQQYDAKYETQYFATLKSYCMHMYNKEATAQDLFIHRNTLLYRLNRIQELFALSLDDLDTALHLLNSFQILEISEHA